MTRAPVGALATLAVQTIIIALAVLEPSVVPAALAGLAVTVFLVGLHLRRTPALTGTALRVLLPTALLMTAVALAATVVPAELPWLPVAAPVAIIVLYAGVVSPLRQRHLSRTPIPTPPNF